MDSDQEVVNKEFSLCAASSSPGTNGDVEFFTDNLLVRIHFTIEMIWWTGLASWVFEFPFPGSLTSTFLGGRDQCAVEEHEKGEDVI